MLWTVFLFILFLVMIKLEGNEGKDETGRYFFFEEFIDGDEK
jgi:hypothetical protein